MTKKKILNSLFWSAIALLTVGVIWSVCSYPSILKERLNAKSIVGLGEYGDIYGGLNTLFTGLAFVGLVVTILLQRQEMKETREEFEEQTKQFKAQSEIMTKQVLDAALFEYLQYMCGIKEERANVSYQSIVSNIDRLQKLVENCKKSEQWNTNAFWVERAYAFGETRSLAYCLCDQLNWLRTRLDTLETWREVYSSWIQRVDQASINATTDESHHAKEISGVCNVYKHNFWKLLSQEDKFLVYMQTAYLSSKHLDEWRALQKEYGKSEPIKSAFNSVRFDEEMQELLWSFLAEEGEDHSTPAILRMSQVQKIFIDYMRANCAKA